jgi:hypothetical protein
MLREAGPRARTAFRHARVWLWRFKRSPEQRDRAAAMTTFAFIGLFALGSVDAIVTGGADFGPGNAYAGEYSSPRIIAPAAASAPTVETPVEAEAQKTVAPEHVDYSFTTEELLGGPEPLLAISGEPMAEGFVIDGEKPFQTLEPVAGAASKDAAH